MLILNIIFQMKLIAHFSGILILLGCSSHSDSLNLKIPVNGFHIVQYEKMDSEGRKNNTLYIAPREIKSSEFNSVELTTLTDSIYAVMLRNKGIGIAANQIGKQMQLFIIEAKPDNPRYKVLGSVPKQIFINPIITDVSTQKMNFWHGCLSAKGEKRGNVATYEWINYKCQDLNGHWITGQLSGLAAVIFQHEFRHMMNGTYLDVANHFVEREKLEHQIELGNLPFFEKAPDSLPLLIENYVIGESLTEFHKRMVN